LLVPALRAMLAAPAAPAGVGFPPGAAPAAPACAGEGPPKAGSALSAEELHASRHAKNSGKSSSSGRDVIEARTER
jgi:hypothetical protein